MIETLAKQGMEPRGTQPGEWAKYLQSELAFYTKIIKDANRKNEKELVEILKGNGEYFTVRFLGDEADQLFPTVVSRRERRDDAHGPRRPGLRAGAAGSYWSSCWWSWRCWPWLPIPSPV